MNYPRVLMAAVAALVVFFVYGFLVEGMLIRKDFALSAALYRTSDLQMKYMPLGMVSVLVGVVCGGNALLEVERRRVRSDDGFAVRVANGSIHCVCARYLQPSDDEYGSETWPGDHREHLFRVVAGGHHDRLGL